LATEETRARNSWYGVSGWPTVFIDGGRRHEGASSCVGSTIVYGESIEERLNETGGMSPIAITGSVTVRADSITMSASFQIVDQDELTDLRATLLVFENGVQGPSDPFGHTSYNGVTRRIIDQPITIVHQGDTAAMNTTIPIGNGWIPDSLHFVAYVQQIATKEIIQGAMLPAASDYSVAFDHLIGSTQGVNGIGLFPARLENLSDQEETILLGPGTPFGDWPMDYLVCGDLTLRTGSSIVTIEPHGVCDLMIRVHTGPVKEIRTGTFLVTSQVTGRFMETRLKLYNGSPSIFLVDNDGSYQSQVPVQHALDANGYLYEMHDVYVQGDPTGHQLRDFDVVIWETGRLNGNCLDDLAVARLMEYVDNGGGLFLTSQNYLNGVPAGGTEFTRDYLGVSSFALDRGYRVLNGVPGDPIGSGLILGLTYQWPSFLRGDDAMPGPTARTAFFANDGSHAMIRNVTALGGKTVFLAEALDGISEDNPDPNNAKTLVARVVSWIVGNGPAGAPEGTLQPGSPILAARPNPFCSTTEIEYAMTDLAAKGPVQLEIFDLSGRRIARFENSARAPGRHTVSWNGLSDDGVRIPSGIYLCRLKTADGSATRKLVFMK
jgi:hypothetical protein